MRTELDVQKRAANAATKATTLYIQSEVKDF